MLWDVLNKVAQKKNLLANKDSLILPDYIYSPVEKGQNGPELEVKYVQNVFCSLLLELVAVHQG